MANHEASIMLQHSKHNEFIARLRWAQRMQNLFGVSSLTIDKKGEIRSGSVAPKIILVIEALAVLLCVWLIYYENESPFVRKPGVPQAVLFYYFIIVETVLATVFNVISVIRMAWPSSQRSLAQCWQQLMIKVQEIQALYRCSIESKRPFQIFWLWLCVLSISYCIFLTYMVFTSAVVFVAQRNHIIFYCLRVFSYLSHTTAAASFALFAMLLRIVLVEMQKMIRHNTLSETQLRSMIQLYRHIQQIIESFCAVYGWVLILIFFEHFLILTDRSFFAIRMYRLPIGFSFGQVVSMSMTWVFPLAVNDMMLIGACVATEQALHEFENQLCALHKGTLEDDSEIALMITSFGLYVAEQKPKFRILNAVNLNFKLLYGSCGVIATYLTVFLQFDSQNG